MTTTEKRVLVTGGSGFIAGHCILQLPERGHLVRTTVRSTAREDAVRAVLADAGMVRGEALSFVEADLTDDRGWAAAVAGCDHVLHVASPVMTENVENPDDVIVPARDGALRVLRAARDGGVTRAVLTSAFHAVAWATRTPTTSSPRTTGPFRTDRALTRTPGARRSQGDRRRRREHGPEGPRHELTGREPRPSRRRHLVPAVGRCHPEAVDPTSTVRIATGNVRVPHEEFLAVWNEASRREAEQADDADWYVRAVAQTCRWMAAVPLRTALCGGLPRSPVTQRGSVARAELIEAESQAAQHPERFSPTFAARPGWSEGVRATFEWAWRHGPPPIEVS